MTVLSRPGENRIDGFLACVLRLENLVKIIIGFVAIDSDTAETRQLVVAIMFGWVASASNCSLSNRSVLPSARLDARGARAALFIAKLSVAQAISHRPSSNSRAD